MGLVYDLNLFSRNSHKIQASDRRRVKPTSYDKYGYPFATFGGSSYYDPVVHVLHAEPGVVVNFVEGPSSRHRPWPQPPIPDHKYNRNGARYFQGRDPFVNNPRSFPSIPPPQPLPPPPRNNYESRPLPLPPVPSNNLPPSPPFMVDEHHPDAHFSMPRHPQPYFGEEDDDLLGHSRPSLHVADPVFLGARNSPQHVPSSLDVALIPNSPGISDGSFHSPSLSHSSLSHHPDDHRYYDALHSSVSSDSPPPSIISASPRVRRFSDFSMPTANMRSVRFHDNPVLPDHWERRKGWFNRRGDQLWDNDGSYVAALEREQYPADLQNYPEPGRGWMNEEGTVIDMKRRLIRKKLRPVLKKTSL